MADVRNGDNRQDQTPPNVQSVFPTGGQTDLSKNTTVTATFSEAMDASTIADASGASNTFTLTEQGATTPVGATVGYDAATKKATLDPSADLKANTIYTATVKGGTSGIKDPAGNALAEDETWSFTTVAPTVGITAPQDGATGEAISTNAEATFSESMDPNTVSRSTFTLTEQGTTQPLNAEVSYETETKKATLDPSADLKANTIYTATVKGGTSGVKDLADIPLAADKSWSFATAAPVPETTGPRLNFNLAIIFVALAVFAYVVTIVVLLAFTKLEAAAVTTVLGTLLAFMGTLAGAYFGIKSTQDTTDKAKGQVEEANKNTEAANKRTERAYRAQRGG